MNESQRHSDLLRFEQLASEKCNGELSPAGYAELHELLAKSSELRDVYWQMNSIHADLAWDFVGKACEGEEASCQLPDGLLADDGVLAANRNSSSMRGLRGSRRHPLWRFGTLASRSATSSARRRTDARRH
jgi:hypothetical protein